MSSLRVRASQGESQSLIDVADRCLINTSESSLKGDGTMRLLKTVQCTSRLVGLELKSRNNCWIQNEMNN